MAACVDPLPNSLFVIVPIKINYRLNMIQMEIRFGFGSDGPSPSSSQLTFHQFTPSFWARFWYGQCECVDSNTIRDRQWIKSFVWRFASQQFPRQYSVAPHIGGSVPREKKKKQMRKQTPIRHNYVLAMILWYKMGEEWEPQYEINLLGIRATFYRFGRHPCVSASRRHSRRFVHFTRQTEIGYFQCLIL